MLLDLAEIIHKQSYDWTNTFLHTEDIATPYKFHTVNLAQSIKEPIIYYQQHLNRNIGMRYPKPIKI